MVNGNIAKPRVGHGGGRASVRGNGQASVMSRAEGDPTARADIITADEVAALLRMTPAWVYAETRRNRIPHMRLGRYFRYRRSTIEAWMSQLEGHSGSGAVVRAPRLDPGGAEPAADRRTS